MDESHESISGEFAGVLRICSHGREKYFWFWGDFKRPVISGGGDSDSWSDRRMASANYDF